MSTVVPFPGAQTAHKRLNSGSNGSCAPDNLSAIWHAAPNEMAEIAPSSPWPPMPASTLAALSRTLIREHQAPPLSRRTRENISVELETIALDLERKSDALKRVGAGDKASALMDAAGIVDLVSKMMECE